MTRTALTAVAATLLVAAAACGNPGSGRAPSAAARMVCAAEAQGDIAAALGVRPRQPLHPTWSDRVYTCRYVYADGVMVLSVKDLPDAAATDAYYTARRRAAPGATPLRELGHPAFATPDGSVYLRKDTKVLHVDVTRLPAAFGNPPHPRDQAALAVAATLIHCWTGD